MKGIILNEDLTLKVANGSLVVGDTTEQNQRLLLLSEKGEYKFRPMRGVGAKRYLESSELDELAREIRLEFIVDGMKVDALKLQNGELIIQASYGS